MLMHIVSCQQTIISSVGMSQFYISFVIVLKKIKIFGWRLVLDNQLLMYSHVISMSSVKFQNVIDIHAFV